MLRLLADIAAPRLCPVCKRPLIKGERALCTTCMVRLPRTGIHLTSTNSMTEALSNAPAVPGLAAAWFHYNPRSEFTPRQVFRPSRAGARPRTCLRHRADSRHAIGHRGCRRSAARSHALPQIPQARLQPERGNSPWHLRGHGHTCGRQPRGSASPRHPDTAFARRPAQKRSRNDRMPLSRRTRRTRHSHSRRRFHLWSHHGGMRARHRPRRRTAVVGRRAMPRYRKQLTDNTARKKYHVPRHTNMPDNYSANRDDGAHMGTHSGL